MVEHILGNYLVESGKITKEQLCDVIAGQDSVRVKLGLIAVSEGMMTIRQAEEVNLLQTIKDKRFGDIAVEEGYLTEEQLEKLLKKQGSAYLVFVQTLVDAGYVTMEDMDWLLDDFRKVNNYSISDLEDIKSDEPDRILPHLLPDEAQEYCGAIGMIVRTIIRLVDRHAYVGRAAMVDSLPTEGIALQKLEGATSIVDCLAERNGALLKLCSIFGQEAFTVLDINALDAAGELLNCANGMFVSELSRQGRFMELTPPEFITSDKVVNVCRIPVFIGNLGLYYAIGKIE